MRLAINRVTPSAPTLLRTIAAVLALSCTPTALVSRAAASSSCPNEAFRAGPGANLPDCRAYEQVSPSDKNGGSVDGGLFVDAAPGPQQAAADGEAITYGSQTTFTQADPASALATTQYLSRRTPGGWTTQAITPRQVYPEGKVNFASGSVEENLYQGFSENLEFGFLLANDPAPVAGAPVGYYNPYLQNESTGAFTLLSNVTPPVDPPGSANCCAGFVALFAGMSTDGSHVIFEANDALTPQASVGRENLYESVDGRLELVNVYPDGEVDAGGGAHLGQSALGFGGSSGSANFDHVLSNDGLRAFWTGADRQLYMHEITAHGPRTVEVSASQKTGASGTGEQPPALYWVASADGSLVYFTSCGQLTDDSTADSEACESGTDLYQYNARTGRLTDITVDRNVGETADARGVLGASEDGSTVYFLAGGALAPGATHQEAEQNNLYEWRDGVTTFIATLGKASGESEDLAYPTQRRTSRVSPDGSLLAFQSSRSLTGYDNVTNQPGACTVYPYDPQHNECVEVYEYDSRTASLICASCNPAGVPPTGISVVPETAHAVDNTRGWQSTTVQQRYLLDDGRLFFQSSDKLVPQASNGQSNVYEWEPDGVGSCQLTAGCVFLISSGTSQGQSYFEDASTDGSNVFIITRQSLVESDGDEEADMYDVRVDGGFPGGSAPPCSGEACRPPATAAPAIYGAPPSATFVGATSEPPLEQGGKPVTKQKTTKAKKKKAGSRKKSRKRGKAKHAKRSGKAGR